MAIQTRGFQVQNMPQFTGADPRLVAFNPAAIPEGILSTFQIAEQYKKLAAFDKMQRELDANRDKRINATGLGFDVEAAEAMESLQTIPAAGEVKRLALDNQRQELPLQGKFNLAELGAGLERQGMENDAKYAQSYAALAASDDNAVTAINNSKVARAASDHALNTVDAKTGLNLSELNQAIARANAQEKFNADNPTAYLQEFEAGLAETKAKKSVAEETQRTGIRPGAGILPRGVAFASQIEQESAELGLRPDQTMRLVGTPEGVSILNKLAINKKGQLGYTQKLTPREEQVYMSLFEAPAAPPASSLPAPTPQPNLLVPPNLTVPPQAAPNLTAPAPQEPQAQTQPRMLTPAQASQLPAGTRFIGVDGIERVARGVKQ